MKLVLNRVPRRFSELLSKWWPFSFKGGWVGPCCPTRDGLTPLRTPTGVGQDLGRIESDSHPRLEKRV